MLRALARRALAFGQLGRAALRRRRGTVVVTYHSVAPSEGGGYEFRTTPEVFADQLDWLSQVGRFVDLEKAAAAHVDSRPSNEGLEFSVTFDDGYRDIERFALPLLIERRVPFTLFVTTGFADRGGRSFLGWKELLAIANSDLGSIGSHTCLHCHLGAMDAGEAAIELSESRERIRTELGTTPAVLSYPFGGGSEYLADAARRAGYCYAFLDRSVAAPFDPYQLPRVCLDGARPETGDLAVRIASALFRTRR